MGYQRGSSGTESLLLGQPRCHDAGGWIFHNGRPGARRRRAARRSTENCVTAAPGTGNDVITIGAYRRAEVTTKVGTPTQGASRKPAADPKLRRRRERRRVRLPREPGRDWGRGGPCSHSTGREAVRFGTAAGSPRTLRKASRTARSSAQLVLAPGCCLASAPTFLEATSPGCPLQLSRRRAGS